MLTSSSDWPTLGGLGAATAMIVELERRYLWLLRICFFAFASVANECEALLLSLLGCEAVASAMLPDIALIAGHAVAAVVEVFAVHTTYRAVKRPLAFLFLKLFEFLLVLFFLRKTLTLGDTLSLRCIAFRALRDSTLRVVFQSGQLLFVKDALRLSFFNSLLSSKSTRFMALYRG